MATILYVLVSALTALLALVKAQVPIPSRPQGFPYNQSSCQAPIHLEVFVDLICSDCKHAFPTILEVADHYGSEMLNLNILMFPLPYHRVAYLAAQGTFVVDSLSKGNATYKWMKTMFDNQDKFEDFEIFDTTQKDVINSLAKYAGMSGVDSEEFKAHLTQSDPSAYEAVIQWKYGCSRTVSGTPFPYINGVFVDAYPTWTLKDWQQVIDPLLGYDNKKYKSFNQMSCPSGQSECQYLPGKTACCLAGEHCIPNVGCRC
ncbi:uncharacterized protein [Amphiura filiformis]|uniref:uncharacterized protein n=1 Tax=Amphiura filiformis TaxID=82378 RepID=UPI003B20E05E